MLGNLKTDNCGRTPYAGQVMDFTPDYSLDEKLPHFIAGTVHALSYYGAVPKYLVPDNLKTAVTMHSKDELVLQSAFSDLETFYDTVILPPPPRKPKGKPTVENHVRFLETHLVEELKEKHLYLSGSPERCGQKDRSGHQPASFPEKI